MRVALMQPYFFPYIGYFDLLASSDLFVFYDDAAYSRGGWVSRNRVAADGKDFNYIRLTLERAPLGTPINDIRLKDPEEDRNHLLSVLHNVYRKAPYYKAVVAVVERALKDLDGSLSQAAAASILSCAEYIGVHASIKYSKSIDYDRALGPEAKVISICKSLDASSYVNLSGGRELYSEAEFLSNDLSLSFAEPADFSYEVERRAFVPNLSIIDAMMWVDPTVIRKYLSVRSERFS